MKWPRLDNSSTVSLIMWPWVWCVPRNVRKCENTGLQRSSAHQRTCVKIKRNAPSPSFALTVPAMTTTTWTMTTGGERWLSNLQPFPHSPPRVHTHIHSNVQSLPSTWTLKCEPQMHGTNHYRIRQGEGYQRGRFICKCRPLIYCLRILWGLHLLSNSTFIRSTSTRLTVFLKMKLKKIKRCRSVLIRDVVDDAQAVEWKDELKEFVKVNDERRIEGTVFAI